MQQGVTNALKHSSFVHFFQNAVNEGGQSSEAMRMLSKCLGQNLNKMNEDLRHFDETLQKAKCEGEYMQLGPG